MKGASAGSRRSVASRQSVAPAPKDVSTLAHELDLDIGTISYHLGLLREGGLVRVEKLKQRHLYSLWSLVETACERGFLWLSPRVARGEGVVLTLRFAGAASQLG
jgi:DNA-binding transcriptional ArsR family regulator